MEFKNKYTDIYTYNTKITLQGDEIIIKKYSQYSIRGYSTKEIKSRELKKKNNPYYKENSNLKIEFQDPQIQKNKTESEKKERFIKSLSRAKRKIYELVSCNVNEWKSIKGNGKKEYLKFVTLTFKNNVTDIKKANKELTLFNKKLSYYHTKKNINELKYIVIPELQKRGVWHYHIIYFNLPYTHHKDIVKIWGNGTVGIEVIKNESNGRIASYVTKYISKNYDIKENGKIERNKEDNKNLSNYELYNHLGLYNMKRYSTSKGLKKATNIYIALSGKESHWLFEILKNHTGNKILNEQGDKVKIYKVENEYRGKIIEQRTRNTKKYINEMKVFIRNWKKSKDSKRELVYKYNSNKFLHNENLYYKCIEIENKFLLKNKQI